MYLTNTNNCVIIGLRTRAVTTLFLPTGTASVFPCFCIFPVMPLNIPSVDLTRSQAYDNGALLVQRPHRTNNPDLPHRKGTFSMQQVKTYTSGLFRGEARDQLMRNLKKMAKEGWHVHTVTDEGVGRGQAHTGRLKVVYEK